MPVKVTGSGRYFEDFETLQKINMPAFSVKKEDLERLDTLLLSGRASHGTFSISKEAVRRFAQLTGDWNLLHDETAPPEFHVLTNIFGRPVVHGLASLLWGLALARLENGSVEPVEYVVSQIQNGRFLRPVFPGDNLKCLYSTVYREYSNIYHASSEMLFNVLKGEKQVLSCNLTFVEKPFECIPPEAILAWVVGAVHEYGLWNGTCLAFVSFDKGKVHEYVVPGIKLWPRLTVVEKTDMGDRGIVKFCSEVFSGNDLVMEAEIAIMILARKADGQFSKVKARTGCFGQGPVEPRR